MNIFKKNKVILLRARMESSRLQGKALMKIGRLPALELMLKRLKRCRLVDDIILITTLSNRNKKIVDIGFKYDINLHISDEDCLQKYVCAANTNEVDYIIDLTGDCPFIDPIEIDRLIVKLLSFNCDYVSNIEPRLLPIGFDIQVYKTSILRKVNEIVKKKEHRNHTGWNILHYRDQLPGIKILPYWCRKKYRNPDWRLTLDYEEDLQVLNFLRSQMKTDYFSQWDVIRYLNKYPGILGVNKYCKQKNPNEG